MHPSWKKTGWRLREFDRASARRRVRAPPSAQKKGNARQKACGGFAPDGVQTIPPGGRGEGRVRILAGVSGRNLNKMHGLLSRYLEIKESNRRGFGAQKCNFTQHVWRSPSRCSGATRVQVRLVSIVGLRGIIACNWHSLKVPIRLSFWARAEFAKFGSDLLG